jgi:hypothetical protein
VILSFSYIFFVKMLVKSPCTAFCGVFSLFPNWQRTCISLDKRTNNIYKTLKWTLNIEQHELHLKKLRWIQVLRSGNFGSFGSLPYPCLMLYTILWTFMFSFIFTFSHFFVGVLLLTVVGYWAEMDFLYYAWICSQFLNNTYFTFIHTILWSETESWSFSTSL